MPFEIAELQAGEKALADLHRDFWQEVRWLASLRKARLRVLLQKNTGFGAEV